MKLVQHFDAFLTNVVNLSDARISTLDSRVEAVGNFLSSGDDAISSKFIELIPQGSYAQQTIINPVASNDEFDADVLLDMSEVADWNASDYVEQLYQVLRTSGVYRDKVSRKSRCITINYVGEFHMDVVPYLTRHEQKYITNRNTNEFELTNPEGFNAWLDDQNRIATGRLIKVIRILKYLRDYKSTFSAKSVILTILLGERVSELSVTSPDWASDVPTALYNLMVELDGFLQARPLMPSIDDPSCPSENFNHRWDQDQYANFRNWVHTYTAWVADAYEEEDRDESLAKWRRLFGDRLGTFSTVVAKASVAHLGRTDITDTEENITGRWGIPVQLDPRYRVRLRGRTKRRDGFRTYTLADHGDVVTKHRTILFSLASVDVPEPFDVYWKVRNTGEEAMGADAIRGQVVKDEGHRQKSEPTAYKGKHYVEVYIVKDGAVVAMDHHPVIIK